MKDELVETVKNKSLELMESLEGFPNSTKVAITGTVFFSTCSECGLNIQDVNVFCKKMLAQSYKLEC